MNDLKKYLNNNLEINYEIIMKLKTHNVKLRILKKLIINNKNIIISEQKELIKTLIFNNLEKNLSFNIDNMKIII